jgi:large subunit ribosomal protein L17
MRHRVAKTKLSRDMDHRKMLLRNLTASLIENEKIKTTHAKAKFVQPYAETIITKAIKASNSKDKVLKFNTLKELKNALYSDEAVKKLVDDVAVRYKEPTGGYTRVTRIGNRDGDNAEMSRIELTKSATKKPSKPKTEEKAENKTEDVKEVKEVIKKPRVKKESKE